MIRRILDRIDRWRAARCRAVAVRCPSLFQAAVAKGRDEDGRPWIDLLDFVVVLAPDRIRLLARPDPATGREIFTVRRATFDRHDRAVVAWGLPRRYQAHPVPAVPHAGRPFFEWRADPEPT